MRRWKFLVVGANNEDDARELAEQIRREAPPDATVRARALRRAPAVHTLLTAGSAARQGGCDTGAAARHRGG